MKKLALLVALLLLGAVTPAKEQVITGALVVEVADFRDHEETTPYLVPDAPTLKGAAGQARRIRLIMNKGMKRTLVANRRSWPISGAHMKLFGTPTADGFAVRLYEILGETLMPLAFGEQRTLGILVNFSDKPTLQPYTPASIRTLLFSTVSGFDLENSFGKTWLAGDVAGWYTIAQPSTVCDTSTLAIQARGAATAAGVDLTGYTRIVYIFPGNVCAWWGLGTVGGTNSSAFVNGGPALQVVAHEMGHNFGLLHSHGATTADEYGDALCNMGYSSYNWNPFQRERLGWFNSPGEPSIPSIVSSSTVTLDPYEGPAGANPKAFKIGQTYIAFRTKDAKTLGVNRGDPNDANSSCLVARLAAGQSFTDAAGVRITARTLGTTATAEIIIFGGPTPSPSSTRAPAPPTLTPAVTTTPASSCFDDFQRADGALGSGWSIASGGLAIQGGRAVNPKAGATQLNLATRRCPGSRLEADFTVLAGGAQFGIVLRYRDRQNYLVAYRQTGGTSVLRIAAVVGGVEQKPSLASSAMPNPKIGAPFHLAATSDFATITATSDGVTVRAISAAAETGTSGLLITSSQQQAADNFKTQ